MKRWERIKDDGLPMLVVNRVMLGVVILISVFLIVTMLQTYHQFLDLSQATEQYIDLQQAANSLRDASDYLTEKVQRFTATGDRTQMDDYFEEVFTTRRRENAVAVMEQGQPDSAALADLRNAMRESVALTEREYYAMRLVVEATGMKDYPAALDEVTLSAADAALRPTQMCELARDMVHDDTYFLAKEEIWRSMERSVMALEDATHQVWRDAIVKLRRHIRTVFILILAQVVQIVAMVMMTVRLGIRPVLTAARRIREDSPIPVSGALEFRVLAKSYNKMYDAYKRSIENLNFKASHDALTHVYNREGYDLILSTLDLHSTTMLLVDADHFKKINDTYGHNCGDYVLRTVGEILAAKNVLCCRWGGEEFLFVGRNYENIPAPYYYLDQIREEIENYPFEYEGKKIKVTMTFGISTLSIGGSLDAVLHDADEKLYAGKQNGKNRVIHSILQAIRH